MKEITYPYLQTPNFRGFFPRRPSLSWWRCWKFLPRCCTHHRCSLVHTRRSHNIWLGISEWKLPAGFFNRLTSIFLSKSPFFMIKIICNIILSENINLHRNIIFLRIISLLLMKNTIKIKCFDTMNLCIKLYSLCFRLK